MMNIVLVEPEIPQNTGNIGRTCVGLGARLHLVGKLGFSLEEDNLKRAGLDYWPKLQWQTYESWGDFMKTVSAGSQLIFFSTHGRQSLWETAFRAPLYLVFGSESRGFPPSFYKRPNQTLVRIPSTREIRSLNLATAVGVAAYEAARQIKIAL